jgi:hypothetical protein
LALTFLLFEQGFGRSALQNVMLAQYFANGTMVEYMGKTKTKTYGKNNWN